MIEIRPDCQVAHCRRSELTMEMTHVASVRATLAAGFTDGIAPSNERQSHVARIQLARPNPDFP